MPLNPTATMTFTDYEVLDDGVAFHFVSPNPGAGQASDYLVLCTDAELATVTTALQLGNLLTTKLQRKLKRDGIASKLDPFIGQSIVLT